MSEFTPERSDSALRDHIALMVLPWFSDGILKAANRSAAITGAALNAYQLADAMMMARAALQSKGGE
jgi:hypothetical protein